jgi:hypothetical protein
VAGAGVAPGRDVAGAPGSAAGEGERAADSAAARGKDGSGVSDLEESQNDAGRRAQQGKRDVEQATDVDGAAKRRASSAQGEANSERSRVAARPGEVMRDADAPKDYVDSRATIDDRAPSPSAEASRQVGIAQRDAPKDYVDSRATIDDKAPSPSAEASRQVEVAQRDTSNRAGNDDLIREGRSGRDFVEDPAEPLKRDGKKKFDV